MNLFQLKSRASNEGTAFRLRFYLLLLTLNLACPLAWSQDYSEWRKQHDAALKSYAGDKKADAEKYLNASLQALEKFPLLDANRATTLEELSGLYRAEHKGSQAESLLEQALSIREKMLWPENPKVTKDRQELEALYEASGKLDKASVLLEETARVKEKTLGANHPDVLADLRKLSTIYEKTGNYARADAIHLRVGSLLKQSKGQADQETIKQIRELADQALAHQNFAQAETYYKRLISIQEKERGENSPAVADALEQLAHFYVLRMRPADAEQTAKRALAIKLKALKPDDPAIAGSLQQLADSYSRWGDITGDMARFRQAETVFRRQLPLLEKAYGTVSFQLAGCLEGLGNVLRVQGKFAESARYYQRQLAVSEKQLGATDPGLIVILTNLTADYEGAGRTADAIKATDRALKLTRKTKSNDPPQVAEFLTRLADLIYKDAAKTLDSKKFAQSEQLLREAIAIRKHDPQSSDIKMLQLMDALGAALNGQRKFDQAEQTYKQAEAIAVKSSEPGIKIQPVAGLAWVYFQSGRHEKAEAMWKQVIELQQGLTGSSSKEVAGQLQQLAVFYMIDGECHHEQKKFTQAEALYVRAIAILEKGDSAGSTTLKQYKSELEKLRERMRKPAYLHEAGFVSLRLISPGKI